MRLIPGKTKVQIELFKGVSLWDVLIGGIAVAMLLLALLSSLPYKLAICIGIFVIAAMLLVRLDTEPNYIMMLNIIKHLAYGRRYEKVYDDEMLLKKRDGSVREEFLEGYREKNQSRQEQQEQQGQQEQQEQAESGGDVGHLPEAADTDADGRNPDADGENTDADGENPDADGQDTDADGRNPDADGENPDAYGKDTDADGEDPDADGQNTDADGEDPDADGQDSDAGAQPKEEVLSEKELIKRENKILKSKTATAEEKDAVWLARAQRSAAKKEAKKAKKAKKAGKAAGNTKAAAAQAAKPAAKQAAKAKSAGQENMKAAAKQNVKPKAKSAAKRKAKTGTDGISEKELIKQENKILKSKTATAEEKDAVWLARAQRSAAKKEAKKQAKLERAENADYAFMENVMAFTGIKDNLIVIRHIISSRIRQIVWA